MSPLKVVLVNMPFADWHRPSFALSQLAALTRREFPGQVEVDVRYLNQDFATHLGAAAYEELAVNINHLMTGVGDWVFRQIAFPGQPDNTDTYFRRYYLGPAWRDFRREILSVRDGLAAFCHELVERYDLASADVLGFTSMFNQNVPSIALARLVKERNPDVITVFGGANCETPMGDVLARNVDVIDFVFSGPALHSFPDFIGCLTRGERDEVHRIKGIRSRRNVIGADIRAAIGAERDIDDFFEPDYLSFVDSLKARPDLTAAAQSGRTEPILYFETSRGCWWGERSHCTFCGLNGLDMGYRHMAPEVALRQFRWLFSFAPWCTSFHCTDNIMPKNYTKKVFPHLDQPDGATIFYEVKLPLSTRDMRVMSDAGVVMIQPGIEALATDTLRLMNKGTTAFHNIQFLKNCNRFGMSAIWNLLIGFPREEEAVYRKYAEDIPLLTHLPPPSGAFMVRFDRFSPYFNQSKEYNLDLTPMDFYSLTYPFPDRDLRQLAYFFQDMNISAYMENAIAWIGRLNEEIDEWKRRWEAGGDERARLCLDRDEAGEWSIYDSRFGAPRRIEADEVTRAVLQRLSSPARPEELAADLGLAPEAVSRRLRTLREDRMLFEEKGSILSLVLDLALEEAADEALVIAASRQ